MSEIKIMQTFLSKSIKGPIGLIVLIVVLIVIFSILIPGSEATKTFATCSTRAPFP